MSSLGEALPEEMKRVRELLVVYRSIGPGGMIAAAGMAADLDRAAKALAERDLVGMVQVYQDLKEWNE